MTDLISRLREAKEGSRELDALVICALPAPKGSKVEQSQLNGAWCIYEPRVYGKERFGLWEWRGLPRDFVFMLRERGPTTDLSAAMALCERVLPHCLIERIGCDGMVSENGAPAIKLIWVAEIARFGETIEAEAPTAPLALTLAILMAKKESGK